MQQLSRTNGEWNTLWYDLHLETLARGKQWNVFEPLLWDTGINRHLPIQRDIKLQAHGLLERALLKVLQWKSSIEQFPSDNSKQPGLSNILSHPSEERNRSIQIVTKYPIFNHHQLEILVTTSWKWLIYKYYYFIINEESISEYQVNADVCIACLRIVWDRDPGGWFHKWKRR